MVLFISFLFLLLNWVLPGMVLRKVGFESPFPFCMITRPVQHFRSAILDAWRFHVFARLSERKGFGGGDFVDFQGSLQLLTSSHLRERDKMLLRAILCGGVWNGFLLGKAKKEDVPCRFCGKRDGDGHLFWECTFTLSPFSMFGIFLNLLILCL